MLLRVIVVLMIDGKNMRCEFLIGYEKREFILVCRKRDFENNNIGDEYFLVLRDEWENVDDSIINFDLLLTNIKNNTIKLFYTPNGAVVINQSPPHSRKVEYIVIK